MALTAPSCAPTSRTCSTSIESSCAVLDTDRHGRLIANGLIPSAQRPGARAVEARGALVVTVLPLYSQAYGLGPL